MPRSNDIIKFVKRAIKESKDDRAQSATVIRVDGNLADIRPEGSASILSNCRIVGDPNSIHVGMLVAITWEDYNGTQRPVVQGPGGSGVNLSASTNSPVLVDNVTIEFSSDGLRVRRGGIGIEHLNFDPAADIGIGDILPGWSVTEDGILRNNELSLSPYGEITVGTAPDIVKISSIDTSIRIFAGSNVPASAPFSVSKQGHLISSSATIAGWTINTTEIKKTGIVLDSANDQILVGASSPNIIIDGGNKIIKSSNFQSGFAGFGLYASSGSAEFHNVTVRGTIRASVFNVGEITATAGSYGVFNSASEVYADVTTPSTINTSFNLDAKDADVADASLFAVGDLLRVKAWNGTTLADVWCTVNTVTNNSGYSRYSCTLQAGTSVNLIKGMAVVGYGPSGQGYIIMSADNTVGSSANLSIAEANYGIVSSFSIANGGSGYTAGDDCFLTGGGSDGACYCQIDTVDGSGVVQTISLYSDWKGTKYVAGQTYVTQYGSHTGSGLTVTVDTIEGPWSGYLNSEILKVRIGNMAGSFGLGAVDQYGFGVGDYAGGNYMSYNAETADAFILKAGSGALEIAAAGITFNATTIYSDATSLDWQDTSLNKFFFVRGRTNDFGAIHYYTGEIALEPPSALEAYMTIKAEGAGSGDEAKITISAIDYLGSNTAYLELHNTVTNSSATLVSSSRFDIQAPETWVDALESSQAIQVRGSTLSNPSSGVGLELAWISTYGRLLSYNRGTSTDQPLVLRGSYIDLDDSGTVVARIENPYLSMQSGKDIRKWSTGASAWKTGYLFVPLTTKIDGSGWTGGARTTSGPTSITVSSTFSGVPSDAKAILVRMIARDSASLHNTGLYFSLGPSSGDPYALATHPMGGDVQVENMGIVPISSNVIYFRLVSSGTLTMDCWLSCYGYFI
jgi:hypothetical protein